MRGPYKRFLVMMDDQYYPASGTGSVVASFDTLEEALALAKSNTYPNGGSYQRTADYCEVFDCELRDTVWEDE